MCRATCVPRTRCVPSPVHGGGLGWGHATRFVHECPLPTPPPQAGEGSRPSMPLGSLMLPGRPSRADERRGVAERTGLFEPLSEVLDARLVRACTRRCGAGPLHGWNGLLRRRLDLRLRLAPERRVADQELHAVV